MSKTFRHVRHADTAEVLERREINRRAVRFSKSRGTLVGTTNSTAFFDAALARDWDASGLPLATGASAGHGDDWGDWAAPQAAAPAAIDFDQKFMKIDGREG